MKGKKKIRKEVRRGSFAVKRTSRLIAKGKDEEDRSTGRILVSAREQVRGAVLVEIDR